MFAGKSLGQVETVDAFGVSEVNEKIREINISLIQVNYPNQIIFIDPKHDLFDQLPRNAFNCFREMS